jgi:hypothetical protein
MGVQNDDWFFWRDLGVIFGWIWGLGYMMCQCDLPSRQYWPWVFLLLTAALVWELEVLAILIWCVLFCLNIHPFRAEDPYAPVPTQDPVPPSTPEPAAVTIDVSSLSIPANRTDPMQKNQ